jgi:hypothetical protein
MNYGSVCIHCGASIRENKTDLCRTCFNTRPLVACKSCGAKCRAKFTQLCDTCSPIIFPASPVEFTKEGVKLCCSIKHEVYGSGIQNQIFLCCQLPDGHEGRHAQKRGEITNEWGLPCEARHHNRPCVYAEGHRGLHKCRTRGQVSTFTWGEAPVQKRTTKKSVVRVVTVKKLCNAPTYSGSFHCIRKRGHSGRHLYSFQGRWYSWSDSDKRVRQERRNLA